LRFEDEASVDADPVTTFTWHFVSHCVASVDEREVSRAATERSTRTGCASEDGDGACFDAGDGESDCGSEASSESDWSDEESDCDEEDGGGLVGGGQSMNTSTWIAATSRTPPQMWSATFASHIYRISDSVVAHPDAEAEDVYRARDWCLWLQESRAVASIITSFSRWRKIESDEIAAATSRLASAMLALNDASPTLYARVSESWKRVLVAQLALPPLRLAAFRTSNSEGVVDQAFGPDAARTAAVELERSLLRRIDEVYDIDATDVLEEARDNPYIAARDRRTRSRVALLLLVGIRVIAGITEAREFGLCDNIEQNLVPESRGSATTSMFGMYGRGEAIEVDARRTILVAGIAVCVEPCGRSYEVLQCLCENATAVVAALRSGGGVKTTARGELAGSEPGRDKRPT